MTDKEIQKYKSEISQHFQAKRIERGISQGELAKATGVGKRNIARMESNHPQSMRLDALLALSKFLGPPNLPSPETK